MGPVDEHKTLETEYQNPLYKSLQLQVRSAGTDTMEVGGAGRITVKFSPLAWGQMEKERELNKEYKKLSTTINNEGKSRECLYRGLLFANAAHTKKSLTLHQQLNSYYEDQNKLLKRGVGENLYEFKELLSVRDSVIKNQLKITSLGKLNQSIEAALNQRLKAPLSLQEIEFGNFINVKNIKATGLSVEPKIIELHKLNSQARINNLELDIERREANQILDNVELYRWDESLNLGVSYGVQVTLNLPYFNKKAYLKDAVQRQVAVNKLSESQREALNEIDGTELSFQNKIAQFEALKASDYYKTLKSLKKLLSGSKNNSPLTILQTQARMANEKIKILELKHEIIQDYLTMLYHSGKITSCVSPTFLVKN